MNYDVSVKVPIIKLKTIQKTFECTKLETLFAETQYQSDH